MIFILGMVVGVLLGFIILSLLVVGKDADGYSDYSEAFDDGVSYGLTMNRENGAIIATNQDEIMVQYQDGMMKRFREVGVE